MIDLTGLWICKPTEGIYIIQQNGTEISIHGMGIGKNRFDNIGFGKIDEEEKTINGIWQDTPYSVNPQNCVKHIFEITIKEDCLSSLDNTFNYGKFERKYKIEDFMSFFKENK